ncbi:MAG: BspA family leucine-rich repeat surface protein, partial [bacterium]|nr:BspA family leucine-rich repeat surface protein [bacterium]
SESDTEQTYVVNYNSNGGTGTMGSTEFKQGESKKLTKNIFTKDGYVFKGWSISSNSKDVVYTDEEEVNNLTNVYNGVVNLYAVWVKEGVTYEVRYNPNGGHKVIFLEMNVTDEDNHWMLENGVYKSGNKGVSSSTSSIKSKEFTLTETSIISFDWAVSSENANWDYLYYSIYKDGGTTALDGTGASTKIGGYSSGDTEDNLLYETVTKELEPGTYVLEFSYRKDSTGDGGLDAGYVKNIIIPEDNEMNSSSYVAGVKYKLSKNEYARDNYIFKGWSTTLNGNVKYNDEEEVIDLTDENNAIVDLYAVWELEKYNVNIVVQNGIINGESLKKVKYNGKGIFNVVPNEGNNVGVVTCTNDQKGSYLDSKIVIENVTSNTTCTVKISSEITTFYNDGTLIINESGKNRELNTSKHGKILNEYEAMSSSNSYALSSVMTQPWYKERNLVKSVEVENTIKPTYTSHWFQDLVYMENGDFTNLDTSNVRGVDYMFSYAGSRASVFSLTGLSSWDTSKITSIRNMFSFTGANAVELDLDDLSSWNTSSVTFMNSAFYNTGKNSTIFNLDLSGWNTSKVTSMNYMFNYAGYSARTFNLKGLENWDTSKVTNMSYMFSDAGRETLSWPIKDLSSWNTSNVTDMSNMFSGAGRSSSTFSLVLDNWDTSKVTNMSSMFASAGYNAESFSITGFGSWNLSKVTDISRMFYQSGNRAKTFDLVGLDDWDTSSVTSMREVFDYAGSDATTFNIDVSKWNTSNVTSMASMFNSAGRNSKNWSVGDLSNWDTSKVTSMSYMFFYTGNTATVWSVGDLSNWDTSKVTTMSSMFCGAGAVSEFNSIGNLKIPAGTSVRYFAGDCPKFKGNLIVQGTIKQQTDMFRYVLSQSYYGVTDGDSYANLYYTDDNGKASVESVMSIITSSQKIYNKGLWTE